MEKRVSRKLLSFGLALVGFILILIRAIDYAAGLPVDTSGLSGIGIACVVIALALANKEKQKTGKG